MEKHPLHLKNPELQTSPEVQRAVERDEQKAGEKVPNDPAERIEAYMDRLENIFLNPDPRIRERNLEMLRGKIHDALIIKKDNFPESYFELQQRVAREQRHGNIQISDEMREQIMDTAIEDQRHSLDAWINYLSSEDAVYPAWFKFYVWNQVIKLSQFDKERGEFKERTRSTIAPFPEIYDEPLARIADIYEQVKQNNKQLKDPEIKELFSKKFPDLYAEFIEEFLAKSKESHETIQGVWIKYEKGKEGEAERLFQSLKGKNSGWCTAGKETSTRQMEKSDFHVYYTNDSSGQPTQPRIALRMDYENENRIAEVRGILPGKDLEAEMKRILDEKVDELCPSDEENNRIIKKISDDILKLNLIKNKEKNNEFFTKEDLLFIYQINSTIEHFGDNDIAPDIAEVIAKRNIEEDMPIIFECAREQIAHNISEIDINTKAYVGKIEPGIFQKLPENLEYIYTSFPYKRIRRETVEIGGKTVDKLISEMESAGVVIFDLCSTEESILLNNNFRTSEKLENTTFIHLAVSDLGFTEGVDSTDKLFAKAKEFGLELCPADAGPNYILNYHKYKDFKREVTIAMDPIPSIRFTGVDRGVEKFQECKRSFTLESRISVLCLSSKFNSRTSGKIYPDKEFVFSFKKVG